MIEKLDTTQDYSEALRLAIESRNEGSIDATMDDLLGRVLYNIARWSVADKSRQSLGDEDLLGELQLHLLTRLPKVSTERSGKSIIKCLKVACDRKLIDMHREATRLKRTGFLMDIEDLTLATDFFGRRIQQ